MTTLQKFAVIQRVSNLYEINFRNAGVAFQFYEPENCNMLMSDHMSNPSRHSFRDHLVVHRYYRTFGKAVDAEYRRLKKIK